MLVNPSATLPNRLQDQTSPYLRQHAHNPVDWWPWCEDALALARQENKPILLSVGYSACHWCHVMAHESFEDPETAALMNRLYINIKVDREERPDLDKIYQSAHQLLSQRPGGWPLTMFLTPEDRVPFFAGTYFPRESRHGLPAFKEILLSIERAFRQQRQEIRDQNESMLDALASLSPRAGSGDPSMDAAPLDAARRQLAQSFDSEHGGFGRAPKFPHPTNLEFLLRHWADTTARGRPDEQALHMAEFTLERMILGGVYDQLGGGFCRYSVDERWMIPHFEKMLYDNGPLLALCCDAWRATGKPVFLRAAEETADWVMREMQAPEGGYYSTLDADSEGEEGRFYVWSREQVQACVGSETYPLAAARFGLDRPANFEDRWHLHVSAALADLAERFGLSEGDACARLDTARRRLFQERARRIPPGRDDKILTSWNALMIKGIARASATLRREDILDSAERALGFLRTTLWQEGRLLATYKDGKAHLTAYLDDYAYLLDALLELLQVRWSRADLQFATQLADALLRHFEDPDGAFFFTADDHETLIQRPKPLGDDAMPSGNAVAAHALLRLGHLLGDERYLRAAERTLGLAWGHISQVPYAHTALLKVLEEWLQPPQVLVIRAPVAELEHWRRRLPSGLSPRLFSLLIPDEEVDLPGLLGDRRPRQGGVAYLCSGTSCRAPLAQPDDLVQALTESA